MDLQIFTSACLGYLERLAFLPVRFPTWTLPALIFLAALGITLNAAARYTRLLEQLSEYEHLSSELLGFLSALGANIPNYVASLAAFIGGHGLVGIGIIVGSNIYNIAVILGLASLAAPGRHGIALGDRQAREVSHLAWLTATMGGLTLVVVVLSARVSPPAHQVVLILLNLVILSLFALVVRDALRPETESAEPAHQPVSSSQRNLTPPPPLPVRTILLAILALAITLVGVIIMVQAAENGAAEVRLSPIILSLIVLAVATSLPNTVVAYQLARTESAGTSVEEILSSNAINLALGCALPLLFWQTTFPDGLLSRLDVPLLFVLGLTLVAAVYMRRIPRWAGIGLFAVYAVWILLHILLRSR